MVRRVAQPAHETHEVDLHVAPRPAGFASTLLAEVAVPAPISRPRPANSRPPVAPGRPSVVQDRQVELIDARRVGDQVDPHDAVVGEGEAEHDT